MSLINKEKDCLKVVFSSRWATGPSDRVFSLNEVEDDTMQLINRLQPAGAPRLTKDDVYICSGTAALTTLIPDRFYRLSKSTVENIAEDLNRGVAYLLSHNHSSLPIGRTFWGACRKRKMENGDVEWAAEYSAYFLRGVSSGNMSSDDHIRLVSAGIIFDNSVGIVGGRVVCDVCGKDYYECNHYVGTSLEMTQEEVRRQIERGVPGGVCTATINDARCSEISSVYDGAIEGAGIGSVQFQTGEGNMSLMSAVRSLFGKRTVLVIGETEEEDLVKELSNNETTQDLEQETERLRLEREQLEMELVRAREEAAARERETIYSSLVRDGYLSPAEREDLSDFLLSLDKGQAEAFSRFLRGRKPIVVMAQQADAVDGQTIRNQVEVNNSVEFIHNLIIAKMQKEGLDYQKAALAVFKENPQLRAEGG